MKRHRSPVGWRRRTSYFNALPPAFANARVEHVMRHGVFTCRPETPLRSLAQTMAANHVHLLVVTGYGEGTPGNEGWAVVSDLEVVRAATEDEHRTAAEVATRPVIVSAADTMSHAASLMSEHGTSHLVVVDADMRPMGILSSLDIAANLAWGLG
jgi:CBS domain-containing protein